MIDKNFMYAVVGASNHEGKYGYKVFKDLLDGGYKVIPIHPSETEILGEHTYPTLSDYEGSIDVVIFVVPPEVTEMILSEIKML
ncbi:CoA-binding protein [Patescibacteria group bacterium]|nr:CoA-binding protein [Patescibacteria group bacterium]MBU1758742.1 CoA-binding protein [Patescibacteria group bacterium]